MELPNQDKIRTLDVKETHNYFKILEADAIKREMKEKKLERIFQENRKATLYRTI